MEFLFDSANLDAIKKYSAIFPISGITSNPSILKAEGKIDVFPHMRKIRQIIGEAKTLHMQVIAETCDEILADAHAILQHVDQKVYIKVPTTEEGLKAMRILKTEGVGVTATAIYSKLQGFMAIAAGVDFIAPYYNRMENMDIDSCATISAFRQMIDENKASTKILAASFKNTAQVTSALQAGAHTVTVQPALLHEAFGMAAIKKAVDDFHTDWKNTQGDIPLSKLE
ncbi:fructose-6-phosphate aldolase [Caproiciproducens sp. R2]|uniref:fructose-6-phosphate aldolase n=1 Tax=Caproiciproducens sp. R2 TaxID=3435187 RepID=UPI00403376D5